MVICKSPKLGSADILHKYPELEGKEGRIVTVPAYPATWLSIQINDSGRTYKVQGNKHPCVCCEHLFRASPAISPYVLSLLCQNYPPPAVVCA